MGIAADFVLIILAGLLGGILAQYLRLPLLLGYVAAGVLVGPHTAGPTVVQVRDIELLAEIGVALLLFSLGLEISFRDLGPVKRVALLGGPLQIVLVGGITAAAPQAWLGMTGVEAAWLGAMVSLSSTMVVLKTLSATGMTATLASRVMVGLLVVQDLAVIPMLAVLPQLNDLENAGPKVAKAVLVAAVVLAGTYVVGTRVLPVALKWVISWGSRELFLVSVVAVGIGVGYAMHAAGLSFALGAFVAGIILSESEFSHQALSDVVPLRDVFGLLFFVSVGMLFDPGYLVANAGRIVIVVVLILVMKAVVIGGSTWLFGYVNLAPWIVGMGLSQIGEFSFVLARAGLSSGSLSKGTYDLALTATVLTMAVSPILAGLAPKVGNWARRRVAAKVVADPYCVMAENHVIVAGYGRSGRGAVEELIARGEAVVIVEGDYVRFADVKGVDSILGDVTSAEIQHAARIEKAKALILTMPNETGVERAMEQARRLRPGVKVVARAVNAVHAEKLMAMGADAVIQPEREGGVALARAAITS
ncbi:MAG: portal protein [Acidobacteria bacterium]|nr:portal protein [Acidobacteriota bacterium]